MKTCGKLLLSIFIVLLFANISFPQQHNIILHQPKRFIAEWLIKPIVPIGFKEIHRIEATITNHAHQKIPDVFILMTDSITNQIAWFSKRGQYWQMTIIESIPSKTFSEYGFDIHQNKLFIKKMKKTGRKLLLFGMEDTEAFSFYEWDNENQIFITHSFLNRSN